jgi:uncharacterized membrane protein
MESKTKLFGHPVHPMLITFPLGLFTTAVIFDVFYLVTRRKKWHETSYYLIPAGIVGGLCAAVFGFLDWLAIPDNTRAKMIGLWHGVGNVVLTGLFSASWLLRKNPRREPEPRALTLSFIGIALGTITGWLGGELVDRLGVGVDRGAHLDAPSSLSGQSATEVEARWMEQVGEDAEHAHTHTM